LVEYDSVIPILRISLDQYCYLLAALPTVGTAIVVTSEFAYHVSQVFFVEVFVAAFFAEPGQVDFIRDYV
jgi:hypothetical protein